MLLHIFQQHCGFDGFSMYVRFFLAKFYFRLFLQLIEYFRWTRQQCISPSHQPLLPHFLTADAQSALIWHLSLSLFLHFPSAPVTDSLASSAPCRPGTSTSSACGSHSGSRSDWSDFSSYDDDSRSSLAAAASFLPVCLNNDQTLIFFCFSLLLKVSSM